MAKSLAGLFPLLLFGGGAAVIGTSAYLAYQDMTKNVPPASPFEDQEPQFGPGSQESNFFWEIGGTLGSFMMTAGTVMFVGGK